MPGLKRFVVFVVSTLLMGGLTVTAGTVPAGATVSTLCTGYVGCAKLGMSDGGYAASAKTMWWRMYSGHNCTNYAAYRVVRSGLPNTRPWSGGGNATYWGTSMSKITNSTPAVGAIAWWRAGVKPAGSSGHVAYVEKVVSADEIIVSQDSWGGDFSWARITRLSSGWPSGFVHFNDAKILNTTLPSVTGTSRSGSVLTASPGAWSPSDATFAYQWLQDGVAITGATTSTLKLTQAQVDRRITARVTASRLGYPSAAVVSAPSGAVQPGVLGNTTAPTVSGEPRVDRTLSVTSGEWTPVVDSISYAWRADGVPVPGATQSTLTLDPSLVGKRISATVTAVKSGYASVDVTTPESAPVSPGELSILEPPTVTGAMQPGQTLRLNQPGASPRPAVSVQWLRGGVPVPGATQTTYRVTAADLGSLVTAEVRLTHPGYNPFTTRATTTSPVRGRPVLRVTSVPGVRTLTIDATLTAAGVPAITSVLQVRSRGRLLGQVPVRNGVAHATLTNVPKGKRKFRFLVPSSSRLEGAVVKRRIRVL